MEFGAQRSNTHAKRGRASRGSLWERTGGVRFSGRSVLEKNNWAADGWEFDSLRQSLLSTSCEVFVCRAPKGIGNPILRCHRCLHLAFAANSQIASYSCPLYCPFQKVKIENGNVLQKCLNKCHLMEKTWIFSFSSIQKNVCLCMCKPVFWCLHLPPVHLKNKLDF